MFNAVDPEVLFNSVGPFAPPCHFLMPFAGLFMLLHSIRALFLLPRDIFFCFSPSGNRVKKSEKLIELLFLSATAAQLAMSSQRLQAGEATAAMQIQR
jgi:hypothetical protein